MIIGNQITITSYNINANKNKNIKYLYNKVSDIMTQEQVGGVFGRDEIIINSKKPTIKDKLKKLGILFKEITK